MEKSVVAEPGGPGGPLATRPLHFFWIADCSGSMAGNKIQSLNTAIRQAIPAMKDVADQNPHVDLLVRAIAFSSGARWHVEKPAPVEEFRWPDLQADGVTDLGRALKMVADQLETDKIGSRGMPPVLVLVSDGQPTDDYKSGIKAMLDKDWGKKTVRIAIGIGDDVDDAVLQEFIGHAEIKPLRAKNAEQLANYIKWASTVVVKTASMPSAGDGEKATNGPALPQPPVEVTADPDNGEIW